MRHQQIWKRFALRCTAAGLMAAMSLGTLAAANVRLGYIKTDGVNIRAEASSEAEIIAQMGTDDVLIITGAKEKYYEVLVDGKKGYIIDDFARAQTYQGGTVNAKHVALRRQPSTDSKKLATLSAGDTVYVYGKSDGFYKVTFAEHVGYVYEDYIDVGSTSTYLPLNLEQESNKKQDETNSKPETAPATEGISEVVGEPEPQTETKRELHANDPEPAPTQPTDAAGYSLELEEIGEVVEVQIPETIRKVDPGKYTQEELYLLAQVVYAEGKGQSSEGYKAIASVLYNRLQSKTFPNTVNSVCYQPSQFTVVRFKNFASSVPSERAMEAVISVFVDGVVTLPENIMFFKSSRLGRDWGKYRTYYATIGANMFYS